MAPSKQDKKKKEREKRVAQKKVDEARRLAQEQAALEAQSAAKSNKLFSASLTAVVESVARSQEGTSTKPTPR